MNGKTTTDETKDKSIRTRGSKSPVEMQKTSNSSNSTPQTDPERTGNGSHKRSSRNKQRISYLDFYKIGNDKAAITTPPSAISSENTKKNKDSGSVLRFKMKGASATQDPGDIARPTDFDTQNRQLSSTHSDSDASGLQSLQTEPDPIVAKEAEINGSEGPSTSRPRAGSSPLSSVPSDIEDLEEESGGNFSMSTPTTSSEKQRVRSKRVVTVTSHRKRSASASLERDSASDKRLSKSKKIKISSPSKLRKNSLVDLELLPQDLKSRSKQENESRTHMREYDQGSNDGHCSACQGSGKLLCCEDCPRSFHFICIEPPIAEADIPDLPYFCMSCWDKRYGFERPGPGLFKDLLTNELTRDPSSFQLPETIRTFFENVATGEHGEYIKSDEQKVLRKEYCRNGFAEELDPLRLKDRQNRAILCYKCGKSAIGTTGMASCDYCTHHWHFDCTSPPLPGPPSAYKKWKCPLHVPDDLLPKSRQPRESRIIDASLQRGFQNNGNIEIDLNEALPPATLPYADSDSDNEEQLIWGPLVADMPRIKYRIPAKGVVLDFLDACRRRNGETEGARVLEALPRHKSSLESLVDIAMQELNHRDECMFEAERIQLTAIKALMAKKGKDKLMQFLNMDD